MGRGPWGLRTVIKNEFSALSCLVLQSCFGRKESNSRFTPAVIIKEVTATSLDFMIISQELVLMK